MSAKESPGGDSGASKEFIAANWLNINLLAEVPHSDERRVIGMLSEIYDLGFVVSVKCKTCGSWLANPKSVAAHQGPVCRKRAGVSA